MAPKLKVFRTHLGFYDMIVAAPSQKAALEAWGASPHLFAHGFASLTVDPMLVEAALKTPGVVLRRQFGSESKFQVGAGALTVPKGNATNAASRRKREQGAGAASDRAKRQAAQERAREEAAAKRRVEENERAAERQHKQAKRTERGTAKAAEKQEKARHGLQRKLDAVIRERKGRIREFGRREDALAKERREVEQSFETRVVAIQREIRKRPKGD